MVIDVPAVAKSVKMPRVRVIVGNDVNERKQFSLPHSPRHQHTGAAFCCGKGGKPCFLIVPVLDPVSTMRRPSLIILTQLACKRETWREQAL